MKNTLYFAKELYENLRLDFYYFFKGDFTFNLFIKEIKEDIKHFRFLNNC